MTFTLKNIGVLGLFVALALASIGAQAATQNTVPAPAAFSAQGGRGPGRGPVGRGGFGRGEPSGLPLARIGLTAAQKDQVKAIMQSHQDELKTLGDRAMAARSALEAAIAATPVDDNTIRGRAADVAAVEAETAVAHAHLRAEIFQMLTPDQQAQATKLQAEMEQRMDAMRQRRGQRPPQ